MTLIVQVLSDYIIPKWEICTHISSEYSYKIFKSIFEIISKQSFTNS